MIQDNLLNIQSNKRPLHPIGSPRSDTRMRIKYSSANVAFYLYSKSYTSNQLRASARTLDLFVGRISWPKYWHVHCLVDTEPIGHVINQFDKGHRVIVSGALSTCSTHACLESPESVVDFLAGRNCSPPRCCD